MLQTNIEAVPGGDPGEHFGAVSGSPVRANHIGRELMASLNKMVGGKLKAYTELLQESRRQATGRMLESACPEMRISFSDAA